MLMHLNGNIEIFYFRLFDEPEVLIAILWIKNQLHTLLKFRWIYIKKKCFSINDNLIFQLLGFSMSVILDIDPNPDNFVSAGILFTRNSQIGILARLEPNKQAQVYRHYYKYNPINKHRYIDINTNIIQ
jgi:hypothetical protein